MKYFVEYVLVIFSGRESKVFPKKEELKKVKNDEKAIERYKKFEEKIKKWLKRAGQIRCTRYNFQGLYKIVRGEKIKIMVS